jgi:hypothetical protein
MTLRRPTLSMVASTHLGVDQGPRQWFGRLSEAGFNVLDVPVQPRTLRLSLIEAGVGLVVVNRAIDEPTDLDVVGLASPVRFAHGLQIPVYLTGAPSEFQESLAPYTVLQDDLSVIAREWPPQQT